MSSGRFAHVRRRIVGIFRVDLGNAASTFLCLMVALPTFICALKKYCPLTRETRPPDFCAKRPFSRQIGTILRIDLENAAARLLQLWCQLSVKQRLCAYLWTNWTKQNFARRIGGWNHRIVAVSGGYAGGGGPKKTGTMLCYQLRDALSNPGARTSSPHRLVVRTSRCGRDNPGSTPGVDILCLRAPLTTAWLHEPRACQKMPS